MIVEINVPEIVTLFKEIQQQPEKLFEMIRMDIREAVGQYLSNLMDMELTYFIHYRSSLRVWVANIMNGEEKKIRIIAMASMIVISLLKGLVLWR